MDILPNESAYPFRNLTTAQMKRLESMAGESRYSHATVRGWDDGEKGPIIVFENQVRVLGITGRLRRYEGIV